MLNTDSIGFNEIMENTILISDFSMYELMILGTIIVFLFLSIFYIIPLIQIQCKMNKLNKGAKNRKVLLHKIITQKQIENEIEEEIKKLELKN